MYEMTFTMQEWNEIAVLRKNYACEQTHNTL